MNLILIWGCRPSRGVKVDTKMCKDLKELFDERYDKETCILEIPKVFNQFKAEDAQFEMVTSNNLKNLSLVCRKNKVIK